MRNEHGQFAMNIGATSILDQPYLDDDDVSQDSSDEDDTSQDNSDDAFDPIELDDDTNEVLLDNFMASTAQAEKARGAGNEIAQWILKGNGSVVPRRSLRPLKVDEIHSPVEIKKREVFDELIKRRWGTPMTPPNTQQPKAFKKYEDHEQQEQPTHEVEDIVDSTGKLINQQPAYDQIINAEVHLQLGEEMVNGKVIQRTIGPDGHVTGTYDNNPFLNSIIYDVEFPDGQVNEYAANIIAENMLTQGDCDGMSTTLMEAIVDH